MIVRKTLIATSTLLLFSAAANAAPPASAPADNTAYEIKFDRPQKVGQVFSVAQTIEISETLARTVGTKADDPRQSTTRLTLEGTLHVLTIDDQGRQDKFDLLVHKLQMVQGEAAPADLITGDVEIEGTYGDNKIDVALKNGQLSQAAANCLRNFIPPRSKVVKFTNDEVMGSTTKRKVGESWPMNTQVLSASMGLKGDNTTGSVKLDSVKTDHGMKWLTLLEKVESPIEINETNLGKSKSAQFTAQATETTPVDLSNPSDKSESSRHIHAVFETPSPDGATAQVTVDHIEKRTANVVLTGMASTQPAATAPATTVPATHPAP